VIVHVPRSVRVTAAGVLVAATVIGVVIAAYLSAVKLTGGLPACGIAQGCETVATSAYSEILGLPVAVLGLGFSLILLALVSRWVRARGRSVLLATYVLALFGVAFVAYLTVLEVVVIHAVCIWCVSYAASVVVTFAAAAWLVRSTLAAEERPSPRRNGHCR
jgi:uncharacterized membrane protein